MILFRYTLCSENEKERDHLGDLGVDRRMILKWFLWDVMLSYGYDYQRL
jgi:hypothetical protein